LKGPHVKARGEKIRTDRDSGDQRQRIDKTLQLVIRNNTNSREKKLSGGKRREGTVVSFSLSVEAEEELPSPVRLRQFGKNHLGSVRGHLSHQNPTEEKKTCQKKGIKKNLKPAAATGTLRVNQHAAGEGSS